MKRIVFLVIVCITLLVGCTTPVVVQPTPEPEVVLPTEEEPIVVLKPTVEEPAEEELDIRMYRPSIRYGGAQGFRQDVPTLEERDAQEREMIESGTWGVRVTYPEFGSGTAFYFYEPNPNYLPGSYATEDEDAQAMRRLKEQFAYECRRQSCADLPNPTYAEVLTFLEEARISELDGRLLPGFMGSNGCTLVSIEVKKRANERGIRCANLIVDMRHALNAFETTDRGMVWFDTAREQVPITSRTDAWPHWVGVSDYPIKHYLRYVVYIW